MTTSTKTLGILGGMSPESSTVYYQAINQAVNTALGGNHSARILLLSVEFEQIANLQKQGDWIQAGQLLAQDAKRLEAIGTDAILLATNTMHKVADAITDVIGVPFLHLLAVTADALQMAGLTRVGLLGTRFTMADGFYQAYMATRGIEVITPDIYAQDEIHRIIFDELCVGNIKQTSQAYYQQVIVGLHEHNAQAVIFGCTEIGLLLSEKDSILPVFDSTTIHIQRAVDWYLAV